MQWHGINRRLNTKLYVRARQEVSRVPRRLKYALPNDDEEIARLGWVTFDMQAVLSDASNSILQIFNTRSGISVSQAASVSAHWMGLHATS